MINDARIALQSLIALPQHPAARPGFAYARGGSGFVTWSLPVLAENLPPGRQVFWVDAAGRFDPRVLVNAAQAWSIDPFYFLSRVQVAKVRHIEDLETLFLSEILRRTADDNPVVLSHPLALWDALNAREAEERFAALREMLGAALVKCLILDEWPAGAHKPWSDRLRDEAARRAHLKRVDGHWSVVELRERVAVPLRIIS